MSAKRLNFVRRAAVRPARALALAGVLAAAASGSAAADSPVVAAGSATDTADAALARAEAMAERGDGTGARRVLEHVVASHPEHRPAWLLLARLSHASGDHRCAADAYEKALALRRDWRSMYNAARAYARLGARDPALAWLEAAAATGAVPPAQLDRDADLAALRDDVRYAALRDQAERASQPCRYQPESSQFDFWLGEWSVHPSHATQVVGHSRIEKILSNCVVLENWSGANGWSGKSFNIYDRRSGRWHQTWVDQSGAITYFIDGQAGERSMAFRTEPVEDQGVLTQRRLTFTALGPDRVRQHAQRSTDGGRTWEDEYDFLYERVK